MTYLQRYIIAINKIDDYFEYSHESEKDKKRVMSIIDELNRELLKDVKRKDEK